MGMGLVQTGCKSSNNYMKLVLPNWLEDKKFVLRLFV